MIEAEEPLMIGFRLALSPDLARPAGVVGLRLDKGQAITAQYCLSLRRPVRVVGDYQRDFVGRMVGMIEHHRQLLFRGIILEFQRRARCQLDAGYSHVGAIVVDVVQVLYDRRKSYGLYADRLFLFPVETQYVFDVSIIVIVRWSI